MAAAWDGARAGLRLATVTAAIAWAVPAAALLPATERCESGELRAVSRLCRGALRCESRRVSRPERDPGGAARDACVEREAERFDKSWEREVVRAFEGGDGCGFDGFSSVFLEPELLAPLAALRDAELLAAWDPEAASRAENSARAALLADAGTLCAALLSAESRDARRPDPERLAAARTQAEQRFVDRAGSTLERAASRGTPLADVEVRAAADAVIALADAFAARLEPVSISLAGSILAAETSVADSDVNDPLSGYAPNDGFAQAQTIPNPAAVGGYVNVRGSGPAGPSRAFGDESDFFRVSLAAGQRIVLFIADDPSRVDLDLCLYTIPLPGSGDCSLGVGAVESLVAPFSGEFWIEVFPFLGCRCGSNYVLAVGQQLPAAGAEAGMRPSDDFVPGELIVQLSGRASADGKPAARSRAEAAARYVLRPRGGAVARELLLSLDSGPGADASFRALGAGEARRAMRERIAPASEEEALRLDTLLAVKALRGRPEVARADLNRRRHPARVPNDRLYDLQWHYRLIQLPAAWDVTTGDPSVVVAVIDTGVLPGHPDLVGRLVPGYDFVSSKSNARDGDGIDPDPTDPGDLANGATSSFHGTHVAGTVGARSDDGVGVAGVAWNVGIMPVRVLGRSGGSVFDVIQGVRFAAGLPNDSGTVPAQRADVINLSLGGNGSSQAEQAVYDAARAAGSIVVAAAGNDATSLPFYPAAYAGVVSVSAVGPRKLRAPYSNFGSHVDVAAPGGDLSRDVDGDGYRDGVLSALADDGGGSPVFNYVFYQGTSMAAPHVAGVAALMKSVDPDLDPDRFDAFLAAGALTEELGTPGRDDVYGHGLIDAHRAVVAARGGVVPARLAISPGALNFGASLAATSVALRNAGEEALSVSGASVVYEGGGPTGWLAAAPAAVDADGLGDWSVTLERGTLADGTYAATLVFASTANEVAVPVVMRVGADTDADAGVHSVLLLHPATFESLGQIDVAADAGSYAWAFPSVVAARPGSFLAGSYLVVAGTDHDNDGFVCDSGEACGAFPTLDLARPVAFGADAFAVDFDTGFPSALNAGALSLPVGGASRTGTGAQGFRRGPRTAR